MGELKIIEDDVEPMFKDGDGGGGGVEYFVSLNVREVENGYIVQTVDEDEEEVLHVFPDAESLMQHLGEIFGV